MNTIKLLIPMHHVASVGDLRFKKHKTLHKSPKAYDAALYALHKCFLAKYTNADEWAPLYSQLMGQIAGNTSQWARVKETLCDANVLECDNICKYGHKSYCFRLGPVLTDTDWDYSPSDLVIPEDIRPRMEWLGIDKDRAHEIIDEIAAEKAWDSRVTKGWHTRVENFSPSYQICRTGRAYSDANQFPKRVRDTLLIDGEPTAEIDIVNCQPLLLATIYPTRSKEWDRYKDLAERGKVYEELGAFANLTRDDAKRVLILFIFGQESAVAERFLAKSFPELLKAIQDRRKSHYKALAYELQHKESGIIVESVCKLFKAVSIHDGVRVRVDDAIAVESFIDDRFFELWGLRPKITVDSGSLSEAKAA